MSTRCNIHFNHGTDICANIYRHSDGYPGKVKDGTEAEYGVLSDLLTFFNVLLAEVPDNRMGDAEYLAAKFLVWQSQQLTQYGRVYQPHEGPVGEDGYGPAHPLQFLGVSPCLQDHGDIEYIYELDCSDRDAKGCPAVRWQPVGGKFRKVHLHGKPAKSNGRYTRVTG